MTRYFSIAVAAAACALTAILAPANAAGERDRAAVAIALSQLHSGLAREQYIATIVGELRQLDNAGDGLDLADIEEADLLSRAQQRASNLTRLYAFDLNDDGKIAKAEMERALNRQMGSRLRQGGNGDHIARAVDEQMKADTNGDGMIDFAEARGFKRPNEYDHANMRTKRARDIMALDPNKDGRVTATELETLARAAFATVDTDGDGLISRDEHQVFATANRPAQQARSMMNQLNCGVPKPAAGSRFAVVGSYEGEALSTVSVVGQDGVTEVSRVRVEAGAQPLELLLISSNARIWQFTGATARVGRLSVASNHAVGVVGIPRDKITFLAQRDCMILTAKADEIAQAIVRGTLKRTVGREPDMIAGHYKIDTIALPSGTLTQNPALRPTDLQGGGSAIWAALTRFNRAGVVQVDEKAVVSSGRSERYEVLPQEAGLLQLYRDGSLVYLSGSAYGTMKFKIVKPIKRFPAGLAGAHSTTFLLAKGVPMPAGSPGHSCVVSEDTGVASRPLCNF